MKTPPNCWTVKQTIAYIERILASDELMVTDFAVNVVTPVGNKVKLSWNSKHVKTPTP